MREDGRIGLLDHVGGGNLGDEATLETVALSPRASADDSIAANALRKLAPFWSSAAFPVGFDPSKKATQRLVTCDVADWVDVVVELEWPPPQPASARAASRMTAERRRIRQP